LLMYRNSRSLTTDGSDISVTSGEAI